MLEVHALQSIRNGNITNAVEKLEFNLDWALIGLTRFLENKPASPIEQTDVKEIQKVKVYRATFPRVTGTQVDKDVAKVFDLLNAQLNP